MEFVRNHLGELNRMRKAFLSVTLSEAGVERSESIPEKRAQCEADVQTMIENFFKETGWRPNVACRPERCCTANTISWFGSS